MSSSGSDIVSLIITLGRDRFEVAATGSMTWGDVAGRLSELCGLDAAGLRLLYKGKTANPDVMLSADGVKNGTRIMAMKTASQHRAEKKQAAREKLSRDSAAADALRESATKPTANPGASTTSGAGSRAVLGDPADDSPDSYFVRVSHAGTVYRVAFPGGPQGNGRQGVEASEARVLDLKERLAAMTGIAAKDQRLLFSGKRDMPDSSTLMSDLGAKRGSSFMLLGSRDYHVAEEAKVDLGILSKEVDALVASANSFSRQIRGRLLNEHSEMTIAIEHLEAEIDRLRGNIDAVPLQKDCERAEKVKSLLAKVAAVSEDVADLREHVTSSLHT